MRWMIRRSTTSFTRPPTPTSIRAGRTTGTRSSLISTGTSRFSPVLPGWLASSGARAFTSTRRRLKTRPSTSGASEAPCEEGTASTWSHRTASDAVAVGDNAAPRHDHDPFANDNPAVVKRGVLFLVANCHVPPNPRILVNDGILDVGATANPNLGEPFPEVFLAVLFRLVVV